jgi:hypothetical protein
LHYLPANSRRTAESITNRFHSRSFSQSRFCLKQPAFRSRHSDSQPLCRFFQRAFLQLINFDSRPNSWAQSAERISKNFSLFVRGVLIFWIWRVVSELVDGLLSAKQIWSVNRNFTGQSAPSQLHECGVYSDPCKPRRKTGSAVKPLKVNKSSHQSFLQGILGVFAIFGDSGKCAENARRRVLT